MEAWDAAREGRSLFQAVHESGGHVEAWDAARGGNFRFQAVRKWPAELALILEKSEEKCGERLTEPESVVLVLECGGKQAIDEGRHAFVSVCNPLSQ